MGFFLSFLLCARRLGVIPRQRKIKGINSLKALRHIAFGLSIFGFLACQPPSTSTPENIFTESSREHIDKTDPLYHSVVRFDGCTAFWVDSGYDDNHLLMTSRHCSKYQITKACYEGLDFYDPTGKEVVATCKSVIISDQGSDHALLEVTPVTSRTRYRLYLASQVPPTNMALEMVGFPGGAMRGNLMRTSNCRVRTNRPQIAYGNYETSEDRFVFHNCSTWAGNSGGPMLKVGTQIVYGIPASYDRSHDETNPIPSNTPDHTKLARMYLMSDFVRKHRKILEDWGVMTN